MHGPVGEETLPALRSLRELSFCAKACAMVATSDAASALPPLLSSKDPLVAEAAAWTLCTLSCTPGQQERLLRTEDGSLKEILELIRAGGTPADAAAWVLHNVCSSRQNLDRVADAGAVPILAGALVGGCGDLGKEAAVRTLSNLSCHSERLAAQVAEAGALRPLLALLKRSGSSTRLGLGAAMALCQLAMWKGTARILEDDGGLRAGLVGELALLLRSAPFPASGKGETSEHMQRLMDMAPTAVRRLADASKMLRLDLLEAGIVHSLVAVTREPGSSEASVAESAGALLNFLGTGEDGGSSHALEAALLSGAPSALVGVLDCRPSQAARKAAVKALQQLMILSSEGLAAARAAGAVPALLRQLDRWDDENPDPAAELAAMAITIGGEWGRGRCSCA